MSAWDDLEPQEKRNRLLQDPAEAARIIAADRRLVAAMQRNPIDLDALRRALEDDASPDRPVINGMPPLHVAIHRGDLKALETLLLFSASTDDVDPEGANALDEACRRNFPAAVKLLRQFGAETRLAGAAEDRDDSYAPSYQARANAFLFQMVRKGTAEQVRQALDLGADVNATEPYANPSFPPLHHAAALCDVGKVKILLDAGADVFARSSRGHEAVDTMWQARGENLFGEKWLRIHGMLREAGYGNLFDKPPAKLTAADLHDRVFLSGGRDDPTLLAHLILNGRIDYVLELLARAPKGALRAEDLLKPHGTGLSKLTLLDAIGRAGKLSQVFTAAVWQGRLEEMMSLRPAVEANLSWKKQVDFDKARAEVLACRLKDLKNRAPKLNLGANNNGAPKP